jgi:ABC-2 type transport system permease protein
MAPFVVIGLVDVALLMAAGTWLFDVPLGGTLPVVLVGTLLYLMTTLGVGLLISTVSTSQQQSFLGGFLFVLPAILLSGVMTPIRAMPAWLQAVTWLNPVRYYAEVMRTTLLRGGGFGDLWPQLLALAVLGGGILLAVSPACPCGLRTRGERSGPAPARRAPWRMLDGRHGKSRCARPVRLWTRPGLG